MQKLKQFIALSNLTALEVIRQPICVLLAATCVVLIILLPMVISHTLGESEKMIRDSALSLAFVSGLLFGGYAACHILNHEIRRGTAASVLSTPVSRELFFLSKFTGVAMVVVLYEFTVGLTALMATRMAALSFELDWAVGVPLIFAPPIAFTLAAVINFKWRRPFASNAFVSLVALLAFVFIYTGFLDPHGQTVAFGMHTPWEVAPAVVLITIAVLILAALAVSLATRFDVIPTVSICGLVFIVGLMSDYFFGPSGENPQTAIQTLLYKVVPNWQHFWIVDALTNEGRIPWGYVARTGLYGFWYLAGILCFGTFAFRHMDVR